MFSEGLFSLISGDAGVKSSVGTSSTRKDGTSGIFPNIAPDEVILPYVVYSQVHRSPVLSYQGVNKFNEQRWQLSCYGGSYKTVKTLANAVKLLLDGFTGQLSDGTIVGQTIPLSEHDETESVFKGTVYGVILDYSFLHNSP